MSKASKKQEVGIVTYYDAINEGAFLQAYCLKSFLSTRYGCNVVFLKNKDGIVRAIERKKLYKSRNPKAGLFRIKRYLALRAAGRAHLADELPNKEYDVVIVGSDEMWSFQNRVYSRYNTAADVSAKKILSYAVSMGRYAGVPDQDFCDTVKDYAAISVRDDNAKRILESAIEKEIQLHVDPVLLIDLPKEKPKCPTGKYLLVYGLFTDPEESKAIRNLARKRNLQVVSIDIYNKWCKNYYARSPFEFVGYFAGAELIVTSMFHGTMIAIAENKNFVSLLSPVRKNKIETAINAFGLQKKCLDVTISKADLVSNLEIYADYRIDYTHVNSVIMQQRKKTESYFDAWFQTNR